ncbi:Nif3-like dinuclear metal center hexameric protein [Aquibacillus sp. 3ASR75-11]|uniref:GTP cyclohydrolase 1 type 2 homolog n=1 Tax=Terrihalobacillus insolitus TaxID=2950438 RepID=A0A9X3WX10_9BACI|nr:Nif3-like dinuclear metal center hexameric protein [Terrihalobacillus insolitus]MDC3413366.1 Nif3-like dinuclear metal center hexameric protein [Terrihalobacillus insolitus]MDC3424949.1 Nif3-like dinuclear metal center hexameric protein [Terrihalobacillus insolitus]
MTLNRTFTGREIVQMIEEWAPQSLAYDWDNVGLQVGTLDKPIKKVMITLDVLDAVVDEAIEDKVDLIIAHHPILFKPPKQMDTTSPFGQKLQKLLSHDITVYAAHTNLDMAWGGVSDILADALQLRDLEVLIESGNESLVKLAVFVPNSHIEFVREAIGNAGAGHIGNYSHCTFQTSGQGTFKPLEGTSPYIGTKGEIEKVDEYKLETIVPKQHLNRVLDVVKQAHPYEEVAYDVFPLLLKGKAYGVGRIGNLDQQVSLKELCDSVKEKFNVPMVRATGDLNSPIQRVAILGGSGEDFIAEAKNKGADVYITGDITFHEAQDAWESGLNLIDPGHHVEKLMKQVVKEFLVKKIGSNEVEIQISTVHTEPFLYV